MASLPRGEQDNEDGNSSRLHRGEALGANKRTTQVTAVDDLSLDLYHGQITALLGHNGAGMSEPEGGEKKKPMMTLMECC